MKETGKTTKDMEKEFMIGHQALAMKEDMKTVSGPVMENIFCNTFCLSIALMARLMTESGRMEPEMGKES